MRICWPVWAAFPLVFVHVTAREENLKKANLAELHGEEEHQLPPNYTGWSPGLARRDGIGGRTRRIEIEASASGLLESSLLVYAEEREIILVC